MNIENSIKEFIQYTQNYDLQIEHIKTPLLSSQGRKIRGTTLICTSFTALTQLLRSPYTASFL